MNIGPYINEAKLTDLDKNDPKYGWKAIIKKAKQGKEYQQWITYNTKSIPLRTKLVQHRKITDLKVGVVKDKITSMHLINGKDVLMKLGDDWLRFIKK